ncbi:MAG: hypothetical protein ACO3N7_02785 [Kiritimatiellia bacterium]
MNKKQLLFSKAGTPLDELPIELRSRIESDPDLLKEFEAQARVASLMRLKNYELQDPAMEGRMLHRVRTKILNGEHLRQEPRLEIFPDWARMVAVVLVMLGMSFLTHREMLDDPLAAEDPQMAATVLDAPIPTPSPVKLTHYEPFSPVYITFDDQETPNLMTPEFSRQLESSLMELGLDLTNRSDSATLKPVLYRP